MLVDEAAGDRVLVFGSLPPDARDLDLLARPSEERAIAAGLAAEGFVSRGREWARFRDGSAIGVDLVAAAAWNLPEAELAALFDEARPIEGFQRLVRPAPHHALLILARLGLSEKRRGRLEAVVAEDPKAWEWAEEAAPRWGLERALRRLRAGRGPRRLRRRRRVVVALSGLDGSGKSSQAAALKEALERLGHEAVVEWRPILANPSVGRLSDVARKALRRLRWVPGLSRLDRRAEAGESFLAAPDTTARRGPLRSVLTHAWVAYIALTNAYTHRRLARRGRVVIFDRYVLDSSVFMRYLWGGTFRLERRLLRALSPEPLCAFLLDVRGEAAYARKQDQWSVDELSRQAELYRELHTALGVSRLDGERPKEELCAEIAEQVWRALG